jgi:hypothetical protein
MTSSMILPGLPHGRLEKSSASFIAREYCGSYDGAEVRPQFVLGSEGARLRMFMPQHDMQCLVLKIEPTEHMRKVEYLCILCSDDLQPPPRFLALCMSPAVD